MAIQTINLGTYANDGTGDDLRTAFEKVNSNFTELGASDVRNGLNLGPSYITLVTTGATSALGVSTLTFAERSSAPFAIGDSIVVAGVTPAGFNGTKTVTACTTSSVSFVGTTNGPQVTAGSISSNVGKVFAQRNTNAQLEFRTVTSLDNSITFTLNAETLNLKANTRLSDDPTPTLSGTLNLNGNYIHSGDVQTTVFGLDMRATNSLLELLIASSAIDVDFGTILLPTGSTGPGDPGIMLDMNGLFNNGFAGTPQVPSIDFGTF